MDTAPSQKQDSELAQAETQDNEGGIEEPENHEFLNEYAVAGTLESIPKFRASDLHDYRFERGEIITIPLKMAELLEKQGKLFILEIGKEKGSNSIK